MLPLGTMNVSNYMAMHQIVEMFGFIVADQPT